MPKVLAEEVAEFHRLQRRLPALWNAVHRDAGFEHTAVVVPSLSVDQEELAKIEGAPFYEERLLFSLMRLRHPSARVIFITSQPVHPDIVDYYLHLLHGVPPNLARRRLSMLCVSDASAKPLTDKILERPLLIERIRRLIGRRERGYMVGFNSSPRERTLAVALGVPLNGVDPDLLDLGTKSGSRQVFAAAGVPCPAGFENLSGRNEIVIALLRLAQARPGLARAVVKLNQSFSGEGNAIFEYPSELPEPEQAAYAEIDSRLASMAWSAAGENLDRYLEKFSEMGGIVEEFLVAQEVRSPSVQLRVHPDGQLEIVSTHDQILGGPTGQIYLGCRFPATDAYRAEIIEAGGRIGAVLRNRGVIGRFAVDFLAMRAGGGPWHCHAIEINLRMGGTTPPFMALQFLTSGRLDDAGMFISRRGNAKFYRATDHLKAAHYRGLMPEDLIEQSMRHGLRYDPSTETGVLFHMIGAVSQYGKLGLTCIGDDPEQAESFFLRTVQTLDHVTTGRSYGVQHAPLLDLPWAGIE